MCPLAYSHSKMLKSAECFSFFTLETRQHRRYHEQRPRCGNLCLSNGYFCHFQITPYLADDVKVSDYIVNFQFGLVDMKLMYHIAKCDTQFYLYNYFSHQTVGISIVNIQNDRHFSCHQYDIDIYKPITKLLISARYR